MLNSLLKTAVLKNPHISLDIYKYVTSCVNHGKAHELMPGSFIKGISILRGRIKRRGS